MVISTLFQFCEDRMSCFEVMTNGQSGISGDIKYVQIDKEKQRKRDFVVMSLLAVSFSLRSDERFRSYGQQRLGQSGARRQIEYAPTDSQKKQSEISWQ